MTKSKTYWRFRGYDSTKLIFDQTVDIGLFTNQAIEECLKVLTAKAGLSYREIIGAHVKRRTKTANDLLHFHWDVKHNTCLCGDNPHFTAAMVDENGKIIINPHV